MTTQMTKQTTGLKGEKISEHFRRSEFACKCGCGADRVDMRLVAALEKIRAHFGVAVIINSGVRCAEHNRSIGGNSDSVHLAGMAADIVLNGIAPEEVFKFADGLIGAAGGVGSYKTFTHVDVRGKKARWQG